MTALGPHGSRTLYVCLNINIIIYIYVPRFLGICAFYRKRSADMRATRHGADPNSVGRPTRVGYSAAACVRHASDTVGHRRVSATQYPMRVGRPTLFDPYCVGLPCAACPMVHFLGIPRKRSAFCRKRRFLKSAEHI